MQTVEVGHNLTDDCAQNFWCCYNITKMTKQFYNNAIPIQPIGMNYERERERERESKRYSPR